MAAVNRTFITAAIAKRRGTTYRQPIANGDRRTSTLSLMPPNPALAAAVKAAWAPMLTGQAVPMLGERTSSQ